MAVFKLGKLILKSCIINPLTIPSIIGVSISVPTGLTNLDFRSENYTNANSLNSALSPRVNLI